MRFVTALITGHLFFAFWEKIFRSTILRTAVGHGVLLIATNKKKIIKINK